MIVDFFLAGIKKLYKREKLYASQTDYYTLERIREARNDGMSFEFIDVFKKPVVEIIENNQRFFETLKGIKDITILGSSYSEIDQPYLEKVFEMTGNDVYVHFGYHVFEESNHLLYLADKLGVSCNLMQF